MWTFVKLRWIAVVASWSWPRIFCTVGGLIPFCKAVVANVCRNASTHCSFLVLGDNLLSAPSLLQLLRTHRAAVSVSRRGTVHRPARRRDFARGARLDARSGVLCATGARAAPASRPGVAARGATSDRVAHRVAGRGSGFY